MTHTTDETRAALARIAAGIHGNGKPIKLVTKPVKPVTFSAGNIWQTYTVQKTSTPVTTGGNGGHHGNGGGNDGNSNNGGNDMSAFFLQRDPRYWVGAIVSIIGAIALAIGAIKTDPAVRDASNAEIAKAIAQQKIAEATGMAPQDYVSPATPRTQGSDGSQVVHKESLHATTFPCGNDVQTAEGFASATVQYLDTRKQSMRIGPMCALIQVSGSVPNMDGINYLLQVPDPKIPGNYYNCGDIAGYTAPSDKCASFVRSWTGYSMRAVVRQNGFIVFN